MRPLPGTLALLVAASACLVGVCLGQLASADEASCCPHASPSDTEPPSRDVGSDLRAGDDPCPERCPPDCDNCTCCGCTAAAVTRPVGGCQSFALGTTVSFVSAGRVADGVSTQVFRPPKHTHA